MKKGMKRGLSLLLSLAMILGSAQMPSMRANAQENPVVVSTSENTLPDDYVGEEGTIPEFSQTKELDKAASNEPILEGYIEEYFDLGEVETSAIPFSPFTLTDGKVSLKNGTATEWINRLDLTGDAQVIDEFYDTLVEASDNDKTNDFLIEDSYFNSEGNYTIPVVELTGTLHKTETYSEENANAAVNQEISKIFSAYAKYIRAAYDAFDRDHPEVFWLSGDTVAGNQCSYSAAVGTGEYTITYTLTIHFLLKGTAQGKPFDIRADVYRSEKSITDGISAVKTRVNELVNAVPDKSIAEKITYFNEQLTKTNQYNTSKDLNAIGHDCRECTAALTGKTGTDGPVCESYARAFKILCDKVGIPCVLVDGQAKTSKTSNGEPHMWNYVRVDDKWLAVDVTWNDPLGGKNEAISGCENEDWLMVYRDSLMSNGMTFLESHPVENRASKEGVSFTNGPELALTSKIDNTREVSTEEQFYEALADSNVDIIELANNISLSKSTDGKDNAVMINRPVTIIGGSSGTGGLGLQRAGIILGGDVTFENMSLAFNTSVRNAIIANGYSLTINNVSSIGTYAVDLFCGGITDYNGGNSSEIPQTGSNSNITMKGTNSIGANIYAGSLSDVGDGVADKSNIYTGNVDIVLEKDATGFQNIYAHGAREDRSGGHANEWLSNAELYKVTGNVSIYLNDNKNITVDGATGSTKNAAFIYQDDGNGYLCQPMIENVDSITLMPAENDAVAYLAPKTDQTKFTAISAPNNTRLSLENMWDEIEVSSFVGGGEIIFKNSSSYQQKMIIENASGTTKVAVGGIDSFGTGSTGIVDVDRTYVTVTDTVSDHEFVLLPNSNAPNVLLEDDGLGNWTTIVETSTRVQEIALSDDGFEVESTAGEIFIPLAVKYVGESDTNSLSDIPVMVTVNGKQIDRSYGEVGYYYYTGEADTDLSMSFTYDEDGEECFYIASVNLEKDLPGGKYQIGLTIPAKYMADGQSKTISFELLVTVNGIVPKEALELKEITYTPIETSGKTLADTELKVTAQTKNGENVEGSIYWGTEEAPLSDSTVVEKNTWYTWNFKPANDNYKELTGNVMPYCVHQWHQKTVEGEEGITVNISCTEESHIDNEDVQKLHNCKEAKSYTLSYPDSATRLYYTGTSYQAVASSEDITEELVIVYKVKNGDQWVPMKENEVPTQIGKYRASITILGTTASIEYEITYFTTQAVASAPTDWVKEAKISAPDGFLISRTLDGEYVSSILITEESESNAGTEVTYYLKETKTGYITDAKTIIVKVSQQDKGDEPNEPGGSDKPDAPKEMYTVSFNDIDGSPLYEPQNINKGEMVEKPQDPQREGYKFLGWFVKDSEDSYSFENPVTSHLVLVAKWLELGDIEKEDHEDLDNKDWTELQNKIWVAGVTDVTYNGAKHTFDIRVYDGNKQLTLGKDYTISYKNNQNAYDYTDEDVHAFKEAFAIDSKTKKAGDFEAAKAPQVILKMKGDYSGTQYIYFRIRPLSISEYCFAQDLSVAYNKKKVQEPKPVVTWNGKNLKSGKDFTFKVTQYPQGLSECKEPGTYIVTVSGIGNFTGTDTINYVIADPDNQVVMSKVKVDSIKSVKYSDEQEWKAEPTLIVRDGKYTMVAGTDYTVEYQNNDKVGTAYAVITGKEGSKYVGSKTVSFKITGTSISQITYPKKMSYNYTGEKIKPFEMGFEVKDKVTGVPLKEGEHFSVTYSKNVNRGTATMTLKGNEAMGYSGTTKITFTIAAASTKNLSVSFVGASGEESITTPYMKGGAKPAMLVKDGTTVLEEGVDYSVSYKNNKKAANAGDGTKAPLVTIQGKGNYKDKVERKFTIVNKALSKENGITVVAKDIVFKNKANAYYQKFKVYDADGVALSTSDYDVKSAVYEEVSVTKDGIVTVNQTLDKTSKVLAGSVVRITVSGKGVYEGGSVSGLYRILEPGYDIKNATIQIQNQDYTGNAVEITSQEQFVVNKVFAKINKSTTRDLVLGKDLEVVPGSYKKNVKKGTATVTLRGIGDFGGEKTVKFKIVQRNVTTNWWNKK